MIKTVTPKLLEFLKRLLSTRNFNVIESSFALWENDHLVTAIWEAFNKETIASLKDPLKALGRDDVWATEVSNVVSFTTSSMDATVLLPPLTTWFVCVAMCT